MVAGDERQIDGGVDVEAVGLRRGRGGRARLDGARAVGVELGRGEIAGALVVATRETEPRVRRVVAGGVERRRERRGRGGAGAEREGGEEIGERAMHAAIRAEDGGARRCDRRIIGSVIGALVLLALVDAPTLSSRGRPRARPAAWPDAAGQRARPATAGLLYFFGAVCTISSTRRLYARPVLVLFAATGAVEPLPSAVMRSALMP